MSVKTQKGGRREAWGLAGMPMLLACALRCISRFSCLQGLSLRLICCQKELATDCF